MVSDPAERGRLVEYIALEQAEIDEWRALPPNHRWAELASNGIEVAQAAIAKYMALLAEGEDDV